MSSQEPLTLDQLGETYEVIGEMSGREDARTFMAKRRADGADVLISVASTPAGDEGNALSHLAADANLLAGRVHRNLAPIVEGRWVGTDAFAIVSERMNARSLDELLARREEEFDFPRIAMILQEVNGLLEWARSQKVVHRAIGLNTLYLEPGSDRVLVTFVVRPLPLAGMPGPEEDARTIAQLARAMLTRSAAAPERANRPLAELRPGLPTRVVEQTDALLALSRDTAKVPDVRGYIAVIAMAEPLKRSETEVAETTQRLLEEERVQREAIEAERQSCERAAAEQLRLFEKEKEEYAKEKAALELAFAKEKEAAQNALAKETEEAQRALAKESEGAKRALAKESEAANRALAKETEAAQRAIAREKEAIARERASVAKERASLAKQRAELQAQNNLYSQTTELPTPPRSLTPEDEPTFAGDSAFDDDPEPSAGFTPVVVPLSRAASRLRWPEALRWSNWSRPRWNRAWAVPAGAVALVLLVAASVLAFGWNRDTTPDTSVRGAPVARVVESAAGVATVGPDSTLSPLGVPVDLLSGVAARAADAPPVAPPRSRPTFRPVDPLAGSTTRPDTMPRIDTLFGPPPPANAPSGARPRPDTVPRRDSAPKRDSIPRDTLLVRRDTT